MEMRFGRRTVEMDMEMEVMVEIEVMGGGSVGPMCLCISTIYTCICNTKILYYTMKYKRMNEWYF